MLEVLNTLCENVMEMRLLVESALALFEDEWDDGPQETADLMGEQLCEILNTIKEKHLRLEILNSVTIDCRNGNIDAMSMAFLQIAGVFSELELSMIRARVRSGMANAKAKGKQIGRRPTMSHS